MAVPGNAPADLAATELFAVDAYATEFDARVAEVDAAGARIRLDRTAFYPGGGGQPYDLGTFETPAGTAGRDRPYAARPAPSGTRSRETCPTPAPRCAGSSTGPAATS